ncbi:MAG: hypothetical protein FJ299_07710, partial [Planctomycetes bacterium]|nr:hypothetical protein [Planctomycetota bacterium]
MRVLMLGWEFPPHISGGLGTACFGLTQGLAHHGVEVLFVVPRSFGDEDTRYVGLVGADQVPVRRVQRELMRGEAVLETWSKLPSAVRTSAQGIEALLAEVGARDPAARESLRRAFELVAVDSPLRPYLDAEQYEQSLALLAEAGIEPAARALEAAAARAAGGAGAEAADAAP